MSGPFKRRHSLKSLPAISLPTDAIRRASIRRASAVGFKAPPTSAIHQEVPWDILDRCLMPVLFCHAGAVLISNALSALQIWDVTTFTLFIWFTIVTIGLVMFYHNLKVSITASRVHVIFIKYELYDFLSLNVVNNMEL